MSDQPIIELRGINKSFGPVDVLKDVDFVARAGQVTALVGDNGAGKSTLVKCISGTYPIDSGEYLFEGKPVTVHSPARRQRPRHRDRLPGPRAVRQPRHRPEHVPRAASSSAGSCSTRAAWSTRPRRPCASLSVRTVKSVRQRVASLSGGQRQTVAIAKAVLWNSKVVMLDEPTAALGVAQTAQVLEPGAPARRPRPGRRADLAQHDRRARRSPTASRCSTSAQMAAQVEPHRGQPAAARRADHDGPARASAEPRRGRVERHDATA